MKSRSRVQSLPPSPFLQTHQNTLRRTRSKSLGKSIGKKPQQQVERKVNKEGDKQENIKKFEGPKKDKSDQPLLTEGVILQERWKVKGKLGGGGFGQIFLAEDTRNKCKEVAIKTETPERRQVLPMEVTVLRKMQGKIHVGKFLGCGRTEKFNFLVMELLSKSISELRKLSPFGRLSQGSAFRLGVEGVDALKELHEVGFLHRDVKPSNFAMGLHPHNFRILYILDFGLCRLWKDSDGKVRPIRMTAPGFRGTVRYASKNAHQGMELGRRDDLFSLFYSIVELSKGKLPWRTLRHKEQAYVMKRDADTQELCKELPSEILKFHDHVNTLAYQDTPDYDFLSSCLCKALKKTNCPLEGPYDWEEHYQTVTEEEKQKKRPAISVP